MARVGVIGAGAAGISAGRALVAAGLDVVIWEARGRIGGRVLTDASFAPHPVELGAEFVHGERVATWDWIRALNAPTTGAAHAYEMWFHLQDQIVDRETARAQFGTDPLTAIGLLTQRWRQGGRPETSLDRVLELWPELSDRPLTDERRRLIANYMAELAASDLELIGTAPSSASPHEPPETLRHFRLMDGYSSLVAQAAAGLRIVLDAPVTRVRWDGASAEVTAGGMVERVDRLVVTVPLGVLRGSFVEFDPMLSSAKREAIARLNPGHISKAILRFDRVYWPPAMTFLWTPLDTQLWWRPGQGQEGEAPVLTAFFGGRAAQALEGATVELAAEEATRQLGDILGRSLSGRVCDARYVAWGREPYTFMGYSSRPPGGEGLREALALADGALHFAGEATSADHPATVHGAIESGRRVSSEVLASLQSRRRG